MDQESPSKEANTNRKQNGIEFKEGSRLEARDHLGDKWWEAKIVEVDHEGSEVLVHFQGWNGRHDEWIKMDSPRLQPLHRRSRRLSTGPLLETPSPGPSTTAAPPTVPPPHCSGPGPSLYSVGEEVLALWKQNRKFPATILRIQDDGGYLVKFYDGFEKVVRGQCIRRIGKQDIDFVRQCKDQIVTNGDKSLDDEENIKKEDLDNEINDTPATSKLRRERKSKFNVREILNLAPSKKTSSPHPASRSRTNSNDGLDKSAFERSDKVFEKSGNGDEVKRHSIDDKDHIGDVVVDLNDSLDFKSEKSVSETGSEGTPSEKENFNCEMMSKFKSKSKDNANNKIDVDSKGKRERKRKRFADEEPESPLVKVSKKNSSVSSTPVLKNSKSTRVPPKSESVHMNSQVLSQQSKSIKNSVNSVPLAARKKSKDKSKTAENIENKTNNNKTGTTAVNSRTVKPPGVGKNNSEKSSDKSFSYLSFDFNLPHEKMLTHLVEGVTIPGPNKPVIIKAPKLPSGWVKKVVLRGVNHLKWEVVIENTLGKSFKSRTELLRYFDEQKFEANMEHFDFTLDTPLKKIRQIWRTSLNSQQKTAVLSNGVKEDSVTQSNNIESRLPVPSNVSSKTSPSQQSRKSAKTTHGNKTPTKARLEVLPATAPASPCLSPPPAPSPAATPGPGSAPVSPTPAATAATSPPAAISASSAVSSASTSTSSPLIIKGNLSETGQGVRCPLRECNKLFRNDKLLQMHVKHYHPEYAPGDSPTVKDLASHRTLKETEPGPVVAAGVHAADIKPALESEPSPSISNHQEDEFKIPEGKQSVKTDTSLVETLAESVTDHNVDDEADTDGGVTDPAAGESGDTVMGNVGEADTEPLQDTPKPSKSRPRRLRADSMLSLGSDTALATPPPSPADSAPLTSPLTYKMSKKRAQQLRSTPSTPPGELKDDTETMSEGEVVHCVCGHTEGDGMMVQCESCLTWQHGSCLGIDRADQVPDKYMCSVCVAPPLARQSSLYHLDMDWIREGRMTRLGQEAADDRDNVKSMETELKNLSDLMTDLVNLSSILHSLQVKLSVARHRSNPKVFMWSNSWDTAALGVDTGSPDTGSEYPPPPPPPPPMETDDTFETVTENDTTFETVGEDESEAKNDTKAIKKETAESTTVENKVISNGDVSHEDNNDKIKSETSVNKKKDIDNKPVNSSLENGDTKMDIDNNRDSKMEVDIQDPKSENGEHPEPIKNPSQAINSDSQSTFGTQLADIFSSDGFDLQTLLPSVSEMQRMLPDVIKDISGSLVTAPSFPQPILPPAPPPNIIPEPKRLDRDECRQNLLDHIEALQKHVEDRLENVEEQIENIERRRRDSPGGWSGMIVSSKMQDVRSAKIVNNTLPERL